jgi:CBS domain-containing protein
MIKVKELIKLKGGSVWHAVPKTSMRSAIHLMTEKRIGALPVLDENGLVGIISERDILRVMSSEGEKCLDHEISEYMTTEVVTASAESTLEDCMHMMIDHHFRHLPVLEGDELVGIVSIRDLVKKVLVQRDVLINDLENYIVGKRQ